MAPRPEPRPTPTCGPCGTDESVASWGTAIIADAGFGTASRLDTWHCYRCGRTWMTYPQGDDKTVFHANCFCEFDLKARITRIVELPPTGEPDGPENEP